MALGIVIRKGAAAWDVTVPTPKGPVTFDIRAMSKAQRGEFFSTFNRELRKAASPRRNKKAAA
jgi:hypothetical protein